MNQKYPYVILKHLESFEKHEDFLKYLIAIEDKNNYFSEFIHQYYNLVMCIKSIYRQYTMLRILQWRGTILIHILILQFKLDIVVQISMSNGICTFLVSFVLNENKKEDLYSIDFPRGGMPKSYSKEHNWIVAGAPHQNGTLIYVKTKVELQPFLRQLKIVYIFHYDSECLYINVRFEFSMNLRYMKETFLLLSDDVRSNSVILELVNIMCFVQTEICLLTRNNLDLGALIINNAFKNSAES